MKKYFIEKIDKRNEIIETCEKCNDLASCIIRLKAILNDSYNYVTRKNEVYVITTAEFDEDDEIIENTQDCLFEISRKEYTESRIKIKLFDIIGRRCYK